MPSLKDFKKLNSTAEQLFVWQVLGAFIAPLLEPFIRALTYQVNNLDPNAKLTPAELADMVVRGHLDHGKASDEANAAGINHERFGLLVKNAGNPPGPQQLAEALRRKFIPEDAGNDTSPGYLQGIRTSRIADQWAEVIKQLDTNLPGPTEAIIALVRSQIDAQGARDAYHQFGGDPQWFDLLFNNAGEGPTPVEAGVMANRGIIPWEGYGSDATSFQQAVAESRFRNKWQAAFRRLAEYRPPPRTITAMFREGSITQEQATQLLLEYGVKPALIPTYLTKAQKSAVQRAHELTESQILLLYAQAAITRDEAVHILTDHGYQAKDIDLILQAEDLKERIREENAAIAIVKTAYIKGRIDYNAAVGQLDAHHVIAGHRDYLLKLWELDREVGTRYLTAKQIIDAGNAGLLSADAVLSRLMATGYDRDDAALLVALDYVPPAGT